MQSVPPFPKLAMFAVKQYFNSLNGSNMGANRGVFDSRCSVSLHVALSKEQEELKLPSQNQLIKSFPSPTVPLPPMVSLMNQ